MNKKGLVIIVLVICCLFWGCDSGRESIQEETEENTVMQKFSYDEFGNVTISGIDVNSLTEEENSLLYQQARYCQAMTDADIDTMKEIVSEQMVFTHMSGKKQTRDEYFADIINGLLNYYTIGISNPVITVTGDEGTITYTSILNANAYGARGVYHMKGTHHYKKINDMWVMVNG